MKIAVSTTPTSSGFNVHVNQKTYPVSYPLTVWKSFPENLHLPYAEFIAFMSTVHLAFPQGRIVDYQFPAPYLESFFYHGLLMSMPENWTDKENLKLKSSNFVKIAYNSFFKTKFHGFTKESLEIVPKYYSVSKRVMVPFSFGKDSLLTYALCKELGYEIIPIFFIEPRNKYENNYKQKMIKEFEKEFHQPFEIFSVPLVGLKHLDSFSWGWDLLLTQYTMFLIPFLHYYQPEYFFWSNELNCSQLIVDPEGFQIDRTFDQHWRWLQTLNTALRIFGSNTSLGSLVEAISEYADCIILHSRYPNIARYHLTCQAEHPKKRWCGNCYDCANTYLYLVSIGIDPKRVGLMDNMFSKQKSRKIKLFNSPKLKNYFWRDTFVFNRNEKLIAFYLADRCGINEYAVDMFKKEYLLEAKKNLSSLKHTYLSVHDFHTAPAKFIKPLRTIFDEELRKVAL